MQKWDWIYMGLGGTLLVHLIENSRMANLIRQAQQLKAQTRKPILLIADGAQPGFDVVLDPSAANVMQLPYQAKTFAAVVSDTLEQMSNPKAALQEWQRVADQVFVNTHIVFSPQAWLDLRAKYVFCGQTTIPVNPAMNWAIAGGLGYYLYKKSQPQPPKRKTLPPPKPEPEIEAEPEIEVETEAEPEVEVAGAENAKVEPAPLINPEDEKTLESAITPGNDLDLDRFRWRKGKTNLDVGANDMSGVAETLAEKGVTNLAFNPAELPEEQNRQVIEQLANQPADTATLIGVLSQISDPNERAGALQVAHENVRPGGTVYVKEENPKQYSKDVRRFFPSMRVQGDYIVARK